MEEAFFPLALKTGKPLLGICRGIQLMNALLGGSLWQDLPKEFPSGVNHHETPPYDKVAHPVSIRPGNPLYDAVGVTEMGVNSYHHQAVKTLGRGLQIAATAPDGVVGGGAPAGAPVLPGGAVAPGVFPPDRREQPEDF